MVQGFEFGIEMAPILITENIFSRIIAEKKPLEEIDKTIAVWVSKIP